MTTLLTPPELPCDAAGRYKVSEYSDYTERVCGTKANFASWLASRRGQSALDSLELATGTSRDELVCTPSKYAGTWAHKELIEAFGEARGTPSPFIERAPVAAHVPAVFVEACRATRLLSALRIEEEWEHLTADLQYGEKWKPLVVHAAAKAVKRHPKSRNARILALRTFASLLPST